MEFTIVGKFDTYAKKKTRHIIRNSRIIVQNDGYWNEAMDEKVKSGWRISAAKLTAESGKRITSIVPVPEPSLLRKQRDGRTREKGKGGARRDHA